MSVCPESCDVLSDVMDDSISKRAVVKLPELDPSVISAEEIVKHLSKYIHPKKIKGVMFDLYTQCYLVYVADIESVCILIKKDLVISQFVTRALFLLDCYIVDGVYPYVTDDCLREIFERFGHIYTIRNIYVLPNSAKFGHVMSGKREIDFILPTDETEVDIPDIVTYLPYKFKVIKYCFACLTEGHCILNCPDVEDFVEDLPNFNFELECEDGNERRVSSAPC